MIQKILDAVKKAVEIARVPQIINFIEDLWDHVTGKWSVDSFLKKYVPEDFRKDVKDAFEDDIKVTRLKEDTIAYRYHGGDSKQKSYWNTPNMTSDPANDLALPVGNAHQYVEKVIIPKGTKILEGTVAERFGRPGGGYQYYVPEPEVVINY